MILLYCLTLRPEHLANGLLLGTQDKARQFNAWKVNRPKTKRWC